MGFQSWKKRAEIWVPLLHIAIGIVWILTSSRLAQALFRDPTELPTVEILKGWAYVLLTGLLLWRLLDSWATELRSANEILHQAQVAGRVGWWVWDGPAGVVEVSPEFARLLGYASPLDLSFRLDEARFNGRRFVDWLVEAREQGCDLTCEFSVAAADGTDRWLVLAGAPEQPANPGGRMLGTLLDVTRARQAERKLAQMADAVREAMVHNDDLKEEQRRLIATTMQEGVSQTLTAAKLRLSHLSRTLSKRDGQAPVELAAVEAELEMAIRQLRSLSGALRPMSLEQFGLATALEALGREVEESGGIPVFCEIEADAGKHMESADAIRVFRTVQEALDNVLRHAKANRAVLRWQLRGNEFRLEVEDDGVGIPADMVESPGALGLVTMRERVRALGGTLEFWAPKGGGTLVRASIPAQKGGKERLADPGSRGTHRSQR